MTGTPSSAATEGCAGGCACSPQAVAESPARRAVLRGVATVGALAATSPLLAACGSSKSSAAAPAGSGDSSTGAAPATSSSSSAAAPAAVTDTTSVPVGGGKIFADQHVVVTQPVAGQFKAFSSTCTHMGCTVASVSNGIIQCPCHGSQFNIADGSVHQGPAPKPLPAVAITVQGTQIFLAAG